MQEHTDYHRRERRRHAFERVRDSLDGVAKSRYFDKVLGLAEKARKIPSHVSVGSIYL